MNKTNIEYLDYRKGNNRIHAHNGYMLVYCPAHPHAKSKGHLYEHRYLMEKYLGRFLTRKEHIHHRNGDRSDNRIENLSLLSDSQHVKHHHDTASPELLKQRRETARINGLKNRITRNFILCACGCGRVMKDRNKYGRKREYVRGHNAKGKHWRWHANQN